MIILFFGSCARALAEGNYSGLSSNSEGIITPLVALARNGTDDQKARAAHALWKVARDDDDKVAISQAGGITPLVALARDGTDEQKTYATGALRHLAVNADNNVSISRANVGTREKSKKLAGSGGEGGVEAKGARARARAKAEVTLKAKIAEAAEAEAEATKAEAEAETARLAAKAAAEAEAEAARAEARAEARTEAGAEARARLATAKAEAEAEVVAKVNADAKGGKKMGLAPPREARVAEEAPWLKRLRASGVKFKMDQLDEPYLPWEKAQAATNSHSEEHGVSAEAGAEARAYHYDAETPSDAVEAGSEQDDSTNSWKRFYQE